MFDHMVGDIVCDTFRKLDLTWGGCHPNGPNKGGIKQGMLISFRTGLDECEGGHRNVDLLLYADANYVGVYERERWSIRPIDRQYTEGFNGWVCLGYHDSCWTESVHRFLQSRNPNKEFRHPEDQHLRSIHGLEGLGSWYTLAPIGEILEQELRESRQEKRNRSLNR